MVREVRTWYRSVPQSICNGFRGRVSQVRILQGPLLLVLEIIGIGWNLLFWSHSYCSFLLCPSMLTVCSEVIHPVGEEDTNPSPAGLP